MSAIATPPAATAEVTPEDLLRMGGEGKGYELVDGKLEGRNVSFLSSYVAGRVYDAISRHIKPGNLGWVSPEGTSFRCFPDAPKKVRRADTSFHALDRLTPGRAVTEGHLTVAPDLAVEVISPDDYAKLINQKIAEWLGAGVRLVWVIDPEIRTLVAYRPDRPRSADVYREGDTLTGDPVLPGFAVPVADLFKLPVGATSGA